MNHYLDTIMFQIFMVTNLDTGKFQFKNIVEDVYSKGGRKYVAGMSMRMLFLITLCYCKLNSLLL